MKTNQVMIATGIRKKSPAMLPVSVNTIFLVFGGFIYSGSFLGIEGYGYGWDKTRWGLLVLLLALALYVIRHVFQDKQPIRWREDVPATPEEELAHRELATASTAATPV